MSSSSNSLRRRLLRPLGGAWLRASSLFVDFPVGVVGRHSLHNAVWGEFCDGRLDGGGVCGRAGTGALPKIA